MRDDQLSPLKNLLGFVIVAITPALLVGVMWSSHSIVRPGLDHLILRMNYSSDAIESDSLQITGRGAALKVSNGDVLSAGFYYLYLAISLFVAAVGIVCTVLILRTLDRILFGGKVWNLLVAIWSEYVIRQNVTCDDQGGDWGDSVFDPRLRLEELIDPETRDSGPILWYSRAGKFSAILEAHDQLTPRDFLIIVLFHFRAELDRFVDFSDRRIDNWMIITGMATSDKSTLQGVVGTAESLLEVRSQTISFPWERDSVCILADCHPLASKDEEVIQLLRERRNVRAVCQFVSMDEAPLRNAGAFVKRCLKPTEDQQQHQAFQHALIDRFMIRARHPYSNACFSESHTPSAEEWININCTNN